MLSPWRSAVAIKYWVICYAVKGAVVVFSPNISPKHFLLILEDCKSSKLMWSKLLLFYICFVRVQHTVALFNWILYSLNY